MDFDEVRQRVADGDAVVVSTTSDQRDDVSGYIADHVYYVDATTDNTVVLGNPHGSAKPDLVLTESMFDDLIVGGAVVHHD